MQHLCIEREFLWWLVSVFAYLVTVSEKPLLYVEAIVTWKVKPTSAAAEALLRSKYNRTFVVVFPYIPAIYLYPNHPSVCLGTPHHIIIMIAQLVIVATTSRSLFVIWCPLMMGFFPSRLNLRLKTTE